MPNTASNEKVERNITVSSPALFVRFSAINKQRAQSSFPLTAFSTATARGMVCAFVRIMPVHATICSAAHCRPKAIAIAKNTMAFKGHKLAGRVLIWSIVYLQEEFPGELTVRLGHRYGVELPVHLDAIAQPIGLHANGHQGFPAVGEQLRPPHRVGIGSD